MVHEPPAVPLQGLVHDFVEAGDGYAPALVRARPGLAGAQEVGDGEEDAGHVASEQFRDGVNPVVQGAVVKGHDNGREAELILAGDDIVQPGQADGFKAHAPDQIQVRSELLRRHAAVGAHLMVAQHRDARAKEGLRQGENFFAHGFSGIAQNFLCQHRRPKAVVDVDHAHARGAGVEHGQERGQAGEVGPIACRGRDRNDRGLDQAAQDARQGSFHAGHGDDDAGLAQGVQVPLQAVQAGHAHVGDQVRAQIEEPGGAQSLAGHGQIRGAGRDDEHVGFGRPGVRRKQVRAQAEEPGLLPQASVREDTQQFPALSLGDSGGQDGVVPPEGVQGRGDLLLGLALSVDHLAHSCALETAWVEVQPIVTADGDGLRRRFAGDGSGRDIAQQLFEILGIHERMYLIK